MSEVDYGPLTGLIGIWRGDRGMDVAPDPTGIEENPYYEEIVFEAAGDVSNAEEQTLAIVRYHQEVRRKSNDEVFHDQIGYWTWDPATKTVAHSIVIPRVVAVLAGGTFEGDPRAAEITLAVRAARGDADWGIIESPFMRHKASTRAFEYRATLRGDRLEYSETTTVRIYDREVAHTDTNVLTKV